MARKFGVYGAARPWLGDLADAIMLPIMKRYGERHQFYLPTSGYAQERMATLRQQLERGAEVYLLGITSCTHNSGVGLVSASLKDGVRLITNNEEERFVGVKHYTKYPEQSIEVLREQMAQLGIGPADIHACIATFDIVRCCSPRAILEEGPASLPLLLTQEDSDGDLITQRFLKFFSGPRALGEQFGMSKPFPIIGARHHDNHAYFSLAASPFARSAEPVIITVIDGAGDDNAISLYMAQHGRVKLLYDNRSMFDSLGLLYSCISSTQGGWTELSSEGRYMGAAAWGNNDRLTNPYYRQLRQLVYFGNNGQIYLNRALANWHRSVHRPYTPMLKEILGEPIARKDMWNPDAILNVEDVQHAEITRDRVDKAAATQMLFEDVLFHIVGHLIRTTGSNKLVLTGGTALNCLANMKLLEHFDEHYYERYLGCNNTRLHLWVPPTPGDAGTPMGAAYHVAMANGAPPGEPLRHAFYCGIPASSAAIEQALESVGDLGCLRLGNLSDVGRRGVIADLMAYIVSKNGVIGLFQGVAETGPRALGHRSILANPCNAEIRTILNQLVKFREAVRPLAPMATYQAAHHLFELSPGAACDNYNAYNYMVLTVRARPESAHLIPAVVHKDGTARVQIVRPEIDPLAYAYLKAMGRRVGVEVSVNTSLNVGSPIVQTPAQALQTLKRSKGMHALFLVGADKQAFLVWHRSNVPPKDDGQQLRRWLNAWQEEIDISLI
ncbi:MAG TPA: carbamoyltransferase C-terminal domain-containing protein [Herpetosiphonaceae bacterium]